MSKWTLRNLWSWVRWNLAGRPPVFIEVTSKWPPRGDGDGVE